MKKDQLTVRKQLLNILPHTKVASIFDDFNLTVAKSWCFNTMFLREGILNAWETNPNIGIAVLKEIGRIVE